MRHATFSHEKVSMSKVKSSEIVFHGAHKCPYQGLLSLINSTGGDRSKHIFELSYEFLTFHRMSLFCGDTNAQSLDGNDLD